MTCRCSNQYEHEARAAQSRQESAQAALKRQEENHAAEVAGLRKALTDIGMTIPDASSYEVLEVHRAGPHLVMKIRYACACAFNGEKVMVFLDVTESQVLRWRKIDPHFSEAAPENLTEAPSPAARFPATPDGWRYAVQWAEAQVMRGKLR